MHALQLLGALFLAVGATTGLAFALVYFAEEYL